MLRRNLWAEAGLVNSSIGTVVDVVYDEGKVPGKDLPVAVMVDFAPGKHFQGYTGKRFAPDVCPPTCVPIPIRTSTVKIKGRWCSRINVPLDLAWAMTVHKSQGLTLEKTTIEVTRPEGKTVGLYFVAFSRVRNFTDIHHQRSRLQ